MFYSLPPAGSPVQLESCDDSTERLAGWFALYRAVYVNSGASALGAALADVVRRAGKPQAEVLLPAYTCPEVVSAVLFAGAKPILVDLAGDRPWMDLDLLASRTTDKTVAVVAVSLFGIPERFAQIRQVVNGKGICVVEDNAQRFPERGERFDGDVVVLSFGRGKPVSVLGGGAVLTRDPELAAEVARAIESRPAAPSDRIRFGLKARVYNALISPRLYWLPDSLPFLGLGETRFKPLRGVTAMDEVAIRHLPAGVEAYWRRDDAVQNAVAGCVAPFAGKGVMNLAAASCGEVVPRLLRYPLLCGTKALRDELYRRLDRAGLGASRMYPSALPGIEGLEKILAGQGPFPQAQAFSDRLLTLPTHGGVTRRDVERIWQVFRDVCG